MTVEVTNRSGALAPTKEIASLLDFAILEMNLNPECELNVVFIDEMEMTELHIKWMDEGGPTDVLSFPMDLPQTQDEAVTLGDIVIAPTVAEAQALSAGHSPAHEMYILAVHGLLHILGYDHAEPGEKKVMFDLQEDLVKKWSTHS